MGKKTGYALLGLGVFLVGLALLSRFYVYDQFAVVPLDQERVSVSEGDDATIFDIASQEEITVDLVSTRNVVGDVEASEEASDQTGRDVAIWETLVYTDEPGAEVSEENPPRSGTHDRVAFDRHTGEAINCCDTYMSSTADLDSGVEQRDEQTPITGNYFKLPFNAEKKTYQFWDTTLKDSTDLQYRGTEEIQGVTVYKYEQVIEPTDVADIDAPASLFGVDEEGDITLDRIYSNTRTLWVEPETGVVIRGQEEQYSTAEYQGEQVATLTDVVIAYNEKTVTDNVDDYSPLASQLRLIRVWVPIIGGVVGVLLILVGIALILRGRPGRRRIA